MFFDHYPYTNFHNVNLDWVLQAVKAWGQTVEANDRAFRDLKEANEDFKAYVTNYLQDLDITDEINTKLDNMLASGILTPYFAPYVQGYVNSWLNSHVTPTSPALDNTLTLSSAAARADTTGSRLKDLAYIDALSTPEVYAAINRSQVMPGYRVQGITYDYDGHFYVCGGSVDEDGTGAIVKMTSPDFKDAEMTVIQQLGHANDITYYDGYLYVCTVGGGDAPQWGIYKINVNDFTDKTLISNAPENTIGIAYRQGDFWLLAPYRIYRTTDFTSYEVIVDNTNNLMTAYGIPTSGRISQTIFRAAGYLIGWVCSFVFEERHYGSITFFSSTGQPVAFKMFPAYHSELQGAVYADMSIWLLADGNLVNVFRMDPRHLSYIQLKAGDDLNDFTGRGTLYSTGSNVSSELVNSPSAGEGFTVQVDRLGVYNTIQTARTNSGRELYRVKSFSAGTWGEWIEPAAEVAQIKEDLSAVEEDSLTEIPFKQNVLNGMYIRVADGKSASSTKYARTRLIDVEYSKRISIYNANYQMCVAYYSESGDISTGAGYIGSSKYVDGGCNVVLPSNAVRFGVSFRRADQSELTDSDIEAISNAIKISTTKASVSLNAVDGLSTEHTVVNKDNGTIIDYYIGASKGEIRSSGLTVKTLRLPCRPCETYRIRHPKSTMFCVASYVTQPRLGLTAQKVYDGRYETVTVFTTDEFASWLGVYYYSGTNNNPLTPEETYDALKIEIVDSIALSEKPRCYTVNNALELPTTFEEIFALYDGLVTSRPDYVTKNALTSGTLTNYEYIFSTGNYNKYSDAERNPDPEIVKPTILLSSGIHGYERSAVVSLYLLMRDLCNNNYALTNLLNYVNIRVIPVGCPWGYTNNSRLNANGVNINRNFATSTWSDYAPGDPGSTDYAGPSAGSEDETKIIQNWMQAHSDALFYIDFHNSNFSDEIVEISGPDTEECTMFKKRFLMAINRVIPYWQKEREINSADNKYCYTGGYDTIQGRTSRYYAYEVGIHKPFSCETSWNINGTGKHSTETFLVGAEAMGNFLVGMKKYYEEI